MAWLGPLDSLSTSSGLATTRSAPRAAIVGAGISGLVAGIQLLRQGWSVVCFESGSPGSGCTYASIGLVYPTVSSDAPPSLRQALLAAYRGYEDFLVGLAEVAERAVVFARTSLLEAAVSVEDAYRLGEVVQQFRELGVDARELGAAEVADVEPMLRSVKAGALYADALWVDAPSLLGALVGAFCRLGGRLETSKAAAGVEITDGRCSGVTVGDQFVEAEALLVCAGAWSRQLLGRPDGVVMRGQCLVARSIQPRLPTYIGQLDVVPLADGSALVGATQERGESERVPTLDGVRTLADELRQFTRWSLEGELRELRVGIRSCERDGLPLLGPVPNVANLYVLSGLWRNGIGLGPALATDLANQVAQGEVFQTAYPQFRLDDRW